MIPITKQKKPDSFDRFVAIPGQAWLAKHPNPSSEEMPPLWQNTMGELWRAYCGICSYYCFYIPRGTVGTATTDHFLPKSKHPNLAYSWDNYRLACLTANARKGDCIVLDPFAIPPETFLIDFLDGSVYSNPNNPPTLGAKCEQAIKVLKLNDPSCMRKRSEDVTY